MTKLIVLAFGFAGALAGAPRAAHADGCYSCADGTSYVRYSGDDTQDKRRKAEACGCRINGTRAECGAANLKVLCSVSLAPAPTDARPVMCTR